MAKNFSQNPDYSREREFKVILEDIQSQFHVFVERQMVLTEKVDKLSEGQVALTEKVQMLSDGQVVLTEKVNNLTDRMERVEKDLSFVKLVLPTVATKDDLLRLERRLTALEAR